MTIDILICTIDNGIKRIPHMLMPPQEGISYVVSMQYTDKAYLDLIPDVLKERKDVRLTLLEGKGLSRNRNNAIAHADADILVVGDDDCKYKPEYMAAIRKAYEMHPEADIITFQALTLDGRPLHPYPAPYVCSVEITFHRRVETLFSNRFGLGSSQFCSGEEQVWLHDAVCEGHRHIYLDIPIVQTPEETTGSQSRFSTSPALQQSKGACFNYIYGTAEAAWRSVKEAGWYMVHKHINPLPIAWNMLKGIVKERGTR